MKLVGKHMDIVPPLGWNWTDDDWRMYNFFRDLCSCGGVLSGGLFDRYVLLKYNRQHPAKSYVIYEDYVPGLGFVDNLKLKPDGSIEFEQKWMNSNARS